MTDDSATVQRNLDEGVQTVRVKLPAVLAVSTEINEPRYPNFMGIRKASRMQYPAVKAARLARPGSEPPGRGRRAAQVDQPAQAAGSHAARCEIIQGGSPAETAAILVDKLIAEKVI